MTDVELRHLATLAAVVDQGSFGRAASRLGWTQSTVSQHIAALERAVGGRVFDRPGGPRRVQLTPLGQVMHVHAAELLAKADAMHAAVERFKAGEGRLTIGTFQSVSNTLLPVLVRRLLDEFPSCEIRLSEDESESPDLSTVDLLFYDLRIDDADIEHLKPLDDLYYLVSPRGRFPDGPSAFMYGPSGIRVNAVAPGPVLTNIEARFASELGTGRVLAAMAVMPEPVEADALAASITFLLSDDSVNINGVILPSDGGWAAA